MGGGREGRRTKEYRRAGTRARQRRFQFKQALHLCVKRLKNAGPFMDPLDVGFSEGVFRFADFDELHDCLASDPDASKGMWYKRFRRFTLAGEGDLPKTFLEKRAWRLGRAIACRPFGSRGPAFLLESLVEHHFYVRLVRKPLAICDILGSLQIRYGQPHGDGF